MGDFLKTSALVLGFGVGLWLASVLLTFAIFKLDEWRNRR